MCLLIWKSKEATIPENYIRNGFENNPHGAGFAYTDGQNIHIKKGFFKIKHLLKALKDVEGKPAIIHMRIATTGSHSVENCHPFDCGNGWCMGHNGCIPNTNPIKDESDTRAWIREVVAPILAKNPNIFKEDPTIGSFLENSLGWGRVVFMNERGERFFLNEEQGTWIKGVWFSNQSFYASRSDYSYPPRRSAWGNSSYSGGYSSGNQRKIGYNTPPPPKIPEERVYTQSVKEDWVKRRQERERTRELYRKPAVDTGLSVSKFVAVTNHDSPCDTCGGECHEGRAFYIVDEALFICRKCAYLALEALKVRLQENKHTEDVLNEAIEKEISTEVNNSEPSSEEARIIGGS
jgi:glutamine amidotransferase